MKDLIVMKNYNENRGDWCQTFSGRQFWPLDPKAEDICIIDIAYALAKTCRYNGHCRKFYSVAEHSYLVSLHVPEQFALWGLLHDSAEAYVGDIPRPMKQLEVFKCIKMVEAKIMKVIIELFDLHPGTEPKEVKMIDQALLADEKNQIMAAEPAPWYLPQEQLGIKLHCWNPEEAAENFLERFFQLYNIHSKIAGYEGLKAV